MDQPGQPACRIDKKQLYSNSEIKEKLMIFMPQTTMPIGYSMPHGPFSSGGVELSDDMFGPSRFRAQHPATYLVSDLFVAGYMGASAFVEHKPLRTLSARKKVYFTGRVFDQWDLDVLTYCTIHTSSKQGKTSPLRVDVGDLLHAIGHRKDRNNRERLFQSLSRLQEGQIEIVGARYRYMTRLVDRLLLDEKHQFCLVDVNNDVIASIRQSKRMESEFRDRLRLGRNGLAKWLYGALLVFKGGFESDVNCLRRLCGTSSKSINSFSIAMEKALTLLKEESIILEWSLDSERIKLIAHPAQMSNASCGFFHMDEFAS